MYRKRSCLFLLFAVFLLSRIGVSCSDGSPGNREPRSVRTLSAGGTPSFIDAEEAAVPDGETRVRKEEIEDALEDLGLDPANLTPEDMADLNQYLDGLARERNPGERIVFAPLVAAESEQYQRYDSFIWQQYPDTAYGASNTLWAGWDWGYEDALLGNFVCPDGPVTSAILWVNILSNNFSFGAPFRVQRAGSSWAEYYVTWTIAPSVAGGFDTTVCPTTVGYAQFAASTAVMEICNAGFYNYGLWLYARPALSDFSFVAYDSGRSDYSFLSISYIAAPTTSTTTTSSPTTSSSTTTHTSASTTTSTQLTVPAQPTGLQANILSATEIRLTWYDMSNNELGFDIEQKVGFDSDWAHLIAVPDNQAWYDNSGLACGTIYLYRVRACNVAGCSEFCTPAGGVTFACPTTTTTTTTTTLPGTTTTLSSTTTTQPGTPDAPSNLDVTATGQTSANLQWHDNSDDEIGFAIERKEGLLGAWGLVATLGADSVSYDDSGLDCLTLYSYRVKACASAADCSSWSNVDSDTTFACDGTTTTTTIPADDDIADDDLDDDSGDDSASDDSADDTASDDSADDAADDTVSDDAGSDDAGDDSDEFPWTDDTDASARLPVEETAKKECCGN